MLGAGSPILYESHIVGTVEHAKFNPTTQMVDYTIFIHSPNESLLSSNSQFWLESGIHIRTDGTGVSINTHRFRQFYRGRLRFTHRVTMPIRKSGAKWRHFPHFDNRKELESQAGERTLYYVVF